MIEKDTTGELFPIKADELTVANPTEKRLLEAIKMLISKRIP